MDGKKVLALLNKKINSVATDVADVYVGTDNMSIVIKKVNGATFSVRIPNAVNTYDICNKLSVDANNKLCYDGQPIDTDTIVNGLTFNQTTKELKITLNDGQEFKTTIPTEVLTQSQKEALKHISGNTTTVGNETTTTLDFGALQIVEVNNSATGDITYEATFNGETMLTESDVATTTDDGLSDFFNSIII